MLEDAELLLCVFLPGVRSGACGHSNPLSEQPPPQGLEIHEYQPTPPKYPFLLSPGNILKL